MIRARGLSYRRGEALLSDVSFSVAPGESIVIAGEPDTASALLRILATLVRPSSGTLMIAGADAISDPIRARARLAFADAACAAGVGLTVSEFLRWTRHSRNVPAAGGAAGAVKDALGQSGIRPDERIDALAPAARATVSLAAALLGGADVVILEAPADAGSSPGYASMLAGARTVLGRGGAVVAATDHPETQRLLSARPLRLRQGRLEPPRVHGGEADTVVIRSEAV